MKKFLVMIVCILFVISLFVFSGCKKKTMPETAPGTTNAPAGETAPGGGGAGGAGGGR